MNKRTVLAFLAGSMIGWGGDAIASTPNALTEIRKSLRILEDLMRHAVSILDEDHEQHQKYHEDDPEEGC